MKIMMGGIYLEEGRKFPEVMLGKIKNSELESGMLW